VSNLLGTRTSSSVLLKNPAASANDMLHRWKKQDGQEPTFSL
jgi:hypothetical protein